MPYYLRLHYLMNLRDLHIPSKEGASLFATSDLMIRQSYRYRNPALPGIPHKRGIGERLGIIKRI